MSSILYYYTDDFSSIAKSNSMQLEDTTIAKFAVAKEFSENKRINAIDFSQDGKYLLTSSDDDTIRLYDCEKGVQLRELFSKKYGVDLIKHTHAKNTAIHTSTKENDTIRYLSLHDNKYLRYFCGHEKRVVTLCMSPADDTFLSGSLDQTVRLWDLKSDKVIGKLSFTGSTGPIASFDPEGLIFVVGTDSEVLKFFDLRHHDKGPFSTIRISNKNPVFMNWHSLKFSPDGKQMLITTNCEELYVLDAFSGDLKHKLTMGPPVSKPIEHPCEASYSPDSQYILSGAEDGCLHVWSANKGTKVCILKPPRPKSEPVQCVKFNPKYMMIGSASSKMTFWIPSE
jgi:COMPASS component SWD2